MRTIKFRAWDKEEKVMVRSGHCVDFGGGLFYYKMGCVIPTNNLELMQFTGLLDKNGKEIYEGDIITCEAVQRETNDVIEKHQKITVQYEDGYFYPFGYNCGWRSGVYDIEIIGNIYENPNLLTNNK